MGNAYPVLQNNWAMVHTAAMDLLKQRRLWMDTVIYYRPMQGEGERTSNENVFYAILLYSPFWDSQP